LTGAIEEVSRTSGINQAFLGLIVLPIAGNACEHITGARSASASAEATRRLSWLRRTHW
jgi:Ca2+/H+ antiporter